MKRGEVPSRAKSKKTPHKWESLPRELLVLPAKDLVAFPAVMMSLSVGRSGSIDTVERALAGDKLVFLVAQRNTETDAPTARDLYRIGVIANIVRTLQQPDGRYKVLIQGLVRARARSYRQGTFLIAQVEPILARETPVSGENAEIVRRIRENLQVLVEREHLPEELLLVTEQVNDAGELADVILAHYRLELAQAQRALEELDPIRRVVMTDEIIQDDLSKLIISENIQSRARDELNRGQREYFLREQLKQIQEELGEGQEAIEDVALLKKTLHAAELPKFAGQEATKQLSRLERMSPEGSEYALLRTYLEWLADLPWQKRTKERCNLSQAARILDQDHFGLQKAKERILEYLSVRKLNKSQPGPILCFIGPPGVGKTSLGRSIASALNRKFFRMSLGGVRDEAEIRGHRRTYVGALPGRIIQGLKQVGSKNPVVVLDELDKVGTDFRGDPASALLEVLDPQQNREFRDHYLNVNFDLSEVLFIATANTVDTIPDALLDRLEVIQIAGYTLEEKQKIAERFIVPRQMGENGLKPGQISFTPQAITFIIERYTAEAGVRGLEREIGALCRKLVKRFVADGTLLKEVTVSAVSDLLGPTKFDPELRESGHTVGLARGLAWTVNGGEIMPVEASVARGSGVLSLTGQLGSVMQESAQAALFYARANAESLGLDPHFFSKHDFHIHVPSGATPKDGPSAGITIACALVSALSGRPVSPEYAMTGEMTLRGHILGVGGLKEKALAALRFGVKHVIIPFDNIKDLDEIPREQREKIHFVPVKEVAEVLQLTLLKKQRIKKRAGARTGGDGGSVKRRVRAPAEVGSPQYKRSKSAR